MLISCAPRRLSLLLAVSALTLSACADRGLDWDLRKGGLSTADAARSVAIARPAADARGVISYPGYQVAVARRGDTLQSVATRLGVNATELASYNAMQPADPLREGEVLALPRRVAETAAGAPAGTSAAAVVGAPIKPGAIEVTSIAAAAIDRAANVDLNTGYGSFGVPTLKLNSVGMNISSLTSGIIQTMAQKVQYVLEPFQPILDTVLDPIPGISDFSRDIGGPDISLPSLASVMSQLPNPPEAFLNFVHAAEKLKAFSNQVDALANDGADAWMKLVRLISAAEVTPAF